MSNTCIVCEKPAHLWMGEKSTSIFVSHPRYPSVGVMQPNRMLAFCGSPCARKWHEPAGDAIIRGDWK